MVEDKIRALLYEGSGLKPLFNPIRVPKAFAAESANEVAQRDQESTEEPHSEPVEGKNHDVDHSGPLVIDMTVDIANFSRIYHKHTDAVRDLLAQANAIVTDTERMAQVARKFTKGMVVVAPFGHCLVKDKESAFTIGILNATEEQDVTNKTLRKFYKALKQPFLVYGQPLDWVENGDNQTTEDWDLFCSSVDVLLLVGSNHVIPSLALPISAMMGGAVVMATNHYYPLHPASGVLIMPDMIPKPWAVNIQKFEQNLRRLDSLKTFNANYARQISKESQALIYRLARRLKA